MKIFQELSTVERALDVRGQRHPVLAGNLANADTPGFAPLDVDFEAAMAAGELSAGANAGDPSAAERAAG
ncbi:MAG: flagellar basal body rod protein FlgB, partial [Deltaproteobacteria bacterium]|nr:flagellar basal body rod protein FlgB [Deltaproteobacteria bacterium]